MKRYEYFETTADIGIIAYGRDLNELFENAALAVFDIMCNVEKVNPKEEREINVEEEDLGDLLVSWLTELLALKDIENILFGKFDVNIENKNKKYILNAKAYGEKAKEEHELETEVKAITYHKMEIKKEDGLWKAKFIVDI